LDVLLEAHDPRHVYWYLWGATRVLPACERCGARGVAAAELDACRYHPREAVFDVHERDEGEENDFHETATTTNDDDDGSSRTRGLNAVGVWPCCGARAPRFDATDALANGGCCLREHAVERVERRALKLYASPETETVETVLATARRRRALVVEPSAPFGAAATRAAPDANSVYQAGDHANVAYLPLCDTLCDRVSGRTATSPRSETRETRRAGKNFFFPRGAFGRMTETEKAETSRSSRSSAGGSASDASDALELSSSDSDSASDAETPTTPRRRITASRAANASRRARLETETASSTLSARAELSLSELSSLETRGQRALEAPDGSRSVRAPRRQERPDPYRAARRARALRGRAAAAAAGTARAAKPSRLANRKPKEPASPSTFSFGLPKDAYDALPEKLRRAVRRDALREADAARVAELERELRALRRTRARPSRKVST
jgi:hypothetical protein